LNKNVILGAVGRLQDDLFAAGKFSDDRTTQSRGMLARTIRIKNSGPAKLKSSAESVAFHRLPQLIFATGVGGRRSQWRGFFGRFLVGDLVFDASAQTHEVIGSEIIDPAEKADAAFEEFEVVRRFQINPGRCNPRCMHAYVRPESLDLVPRRIIEGSP